jgi:hypothetical protein
MKLHGCRGVLALASLLALASSLGCGDPCLDDGKGKGVCNAQDSNETTAAQTETAEAEGMEAEAEVEAEGMEAEAEAGAECMNGMQDPGETDVDCGGPCVDDNDGSGKCNDGQLCEIDNDCESDFCDGGVCAPAEPDECTNNMQDGSETDVDCGGACVEDAGDPNNPAGKCDDGELCDLDGDCVSNLCDMGVCGGGPDECMNMMTDPGETDVDCGGDCVEDPNDPDNDVGKCQIGEVCLADSDCASELCTDGICSENPCGDMTQNNDETDVDCGGACVADPNDPLNPDGKCDNGEGCLIDSDCVSNVCDPDNNVCVDVCMNMTQDEAETDVDCGGACVVDPNDPLNPEGKCDEGQGCLLDSDCISNACDPDTNVCVGVCENGMLDPEQETDVDCGDQCVAVNPDDPDDVEGQCNDGQTCVDDMDCVAGDCIDNQCDVCAPVEGYSECATCLVGGCCDAVIDCLANVDKCVCWFNCISEPGSSVQACMDQCGNGNIGMIQSCVSNTCMQEC